MNFPIFSYGEISSTFDQAHSLASSNQLPVWGTVVAESQTAGRGQWGRSWQSKTGNLYASLRLPNASYFSSPEAAIIVAGLLATALNQLQFPVRIKWPNDLVIAKAHQWYKVGGILLEERQGIILAGFGLNLITCPEPEEMRSQAALMAGCLPLKNTDFDMDKPALALITPLVTKVHSCYLNLSVMDWRKLVQPLLIALHQPVQFIEDSPNQTLHQGIFTGLSPDGGLCLRTSLADKVFYSGSLHP